jgi:chorismate dehydratase
MDSLNIACVRYLNTTPLIEGLEKLAGITLIPTIPSRIAGMVRAGEADLGLISVVDAARTADDEREHSLPGVPLALLPVGMIGCDGPTLTVRLFSSVPLETITTLHADTDSHTSVILCQILLRRMFGISPRLIGFDARERIAIGRGAAQPTSTANLDEAWPETVLLIGDKVVTDSPPASIYPHQLDLGEAWRTLTGLPFMYACWACRADRAKDPKILYAAALLDRQRRHNLTRLDWIIARRAPEHRWPRELAVDYLGRLLRFSVGAREQEAANRFIAEAADLQLLPPRSLHWAELQAPVATGV